KTCIAVSDAKRYDSACVKGQTEKSQIIREIQKCCASFYIPPFLTQITPSSQPKIEICSGKWGAGVFKGSPCVKSIEMAIGAAINGVDLCLYGFGDEDCVSCDSNNLIEPSYFVLNDSNIFNDKINQLVSDLVFVAHISDSHIMSADDLSSTGNINSPKILNIFNNLNPDIIIHSGDIVDGYVERDGQFIQSPLQISNAQNIFSSHSFPIVALRGNHDVTGLEYLIPDPISTVSQLSDSESMYANVYSSEITRSSSESIDLCCITVSMMFDPLLTAPFDFTPVSPIISSTRRAKELNTSIEMCPFSSRKLFISHYPLSFLQPSISTDLAIFLASHDIHAALSGHTHMRDNVNSIPIPKELITSPLQLNSSYTHSHVIDLVSPAAKYGLATLVVLYPDNYITSSQIIEDSINSPHGLVIYPPDSRITPLNQWDGTVCVWTDAEEVHLQMVDISGNSSDSGLEQSIYSLDEYIIDGKRLMCVQMPDDFVVAFDDLAPKQYLHFDISMFKDSSESIYTTIHHHTFISHSLLSPEPHSGPALSSFLQSTSYGGKANIGTFSTGPYLRLIQRFGWFGWSFFLWIPVGISGIFWMVSWIISIIRSSPKETEDNNNVQMEHLRKVWKSEIIRSFLVGGKISIDSSGQYRASPLYAVFKKNLYGKKVVLTVNDHLCSIPLVIGSGGNVCIPLYSEKDEAKDLPNPDLFDGEKSEITHDTSQKEPIEAEMHSPYLYFPTVFLPHWFDVNFELDLTLILKKGKDIYRSIQQEFASIPPGLIDPPCAYSAQQKTIFDAHIIRKIDVIRICKYPIYALFHTYVLSRDSEDSPLVIRGLWQCHSMSKYINSLQICHFRGLSPKKNSLSSHFYGEELDFVTVLPRGILPRKIDEKLIPKPILPLMVPPSLVKQFGSEVEAAFSLRLDRFQEALSALHFTPGHNKALISVVDIDRKGREVHHSISFGIYFYPVSTGSSPSVCVSDIDGTLTKSDARFIFEPFFKDLFHANTHMFFQKLKEKCPVVYLTMRSISLIERTEKLLKKTVEGTDKTKKLLKLPDGPKLLCPISTLKSFTIAKLSWMIIIQRLFYPNSWDYEMDPVSISPNRPDVIKVAIGNAHTDTAAYLSSGVPANRIFSINPTSLLQSFTSGFQKISFDYETFLKGELKDLDELDL
ncbi:putative multi-domain containing protein, partial [Aduncisulcus paluster]